MGCNVWVWVWMGWSVGGSEVISRRPWEDGWSASSIARVPDPALVPEGHRLPMTRVSIGTRLNFVRNKIWVGRAQISRNFAQIGPKFREIKLRKLRTKLLSGASTPTEQRACLVRVMRASVSASAAPCCACCSKHFWVPLRHCPRHGMPHGAR